MAGRMHEVGRGERISLLKRLYPRRHCERSEAIQSPLRRKILLLRCARNDEEETACARLSPPGLGSRWPGSSAVRCSAMWLRRLACGDISALRSRAQAGLTRSSRCASCEGSSRVVQRSPRRQSLRKMLPPTSCHQTVGGFYCMLFLVRSLGSSYQRIIRIIAHTLGPGTCNHFYNSKLADASQFTRLGAGL